MKPVRNPAWTLVLVRYLFETFLRILILFFYDMILLVQFLSCSMTFLLSHKVNLKMVFVPLADKKLIIWKAEKVPFSIVN
jgi:hypothetical protein